MKLTRATGGFITDTGGHTVAWFASVGEAEDYLKWVKSGCQYPEDHKTHHNYDTLKQICGAMACQLQSLGVRDASLVCEHQVKWDGLQKMLVEFVEFELSRQRVLESDEINAYPKEVPYTRVDIPMRIWEFFRQLAGRE